MNSIKKKDIEANISDIILLFIKEESTLLIKQMLFYVLSSMFLIIIQYAISLFFTSNRQGEQT